MFTKLHDRRIPTIDMAVNEARLNEAMLTLACNAMNTRRIA